MAATTKLLLPLLEAAQAQKHVTVNGAILRLDALVQLSVIDRDLATPPGSPADGDRYLVAASPTGAWSGSAGRIALWQDGAWSFLQPRAGWLIFIEDEKRLIAFDGTAFNEAVTSALGGNGNFARIDSIKATTGDPAGTEGMLVINTADKNVKIHAGGAFRTLVTWV